MGCWVFINSEIVVTEDDSEGSEDKEQTAIVDSSAVMLYGLIHARYILSTKGIIEMYNKFKRGDFGACPRVYCDGQVSLYPHVRNSYFYAMNILMFLILIYLE